MRTPPMIWIAVSPNPNGVCRTGRSVTMSHLPIDQQLSELNAAVRLGKRAQAVELTEGLLKLGAAPNQLVDAMVNAMDDVGQRFQCKEIFIPQMLMASLAMSDSMALLAPTLVAAGVQPRYRALIGTVAGDVHNIGKNLVAMMWKGAGFDVVDLGTNVRADEFLKAADEQRPDLIGLSALLTT